RGGALSPLFSGHVDRSGTRHHPGGDNLLRRLFHRGSALLAGGGDNRRAGALGAEAALLARRLRAPLAAAGLHLLLPGPPAVPLLLPGLSLAHPCRLPAPTRQPRVLDVVALGHAVHSRFRPRHHLDAAVSIPTVPRRRALAEMGLRSRRRCAACHPYGCELE